MYGKYYYRLEQIDKDGSFEYSDVIEVDVPILQDYAILNKTIQTRLIPKQRYALW